PAPAPANDGRLTEEEWNTRNAAKHAQSTHGDLIKQVTTLERENARLKEVQVPRGGRALTTEEAAAYDAYVALGKPDELKTKVEQGEKDGAELVGVRTQKSLDDAARDAGYKPSVLADRVKAAGLTVLPSREVERDGKKVMVPFVKDASGAEHELPAYATQHWGDYLPALTSAASSTTTTTTGAEVGGKQDSAASGSGGGTGGSWVQQALAKSTTGGAAYVDPLQAQKPAAN
ncbi:hypothetical protein, partial [Deinococcus marmoris]